jgi:hypothetical protein
VYFGATLLLTATYNPAAVVSHVFIRFKVRLVWTSSTHVSAALDGDGNYYPYTAGSNETGSVPTSANSIVVKLTPSATAVKVDFGAVIANQIS